MNPVSICIAVNERNQKAIAKAHAEFKPVHIRELTRTTKNHVVLVMSYGHVAELRILDHEILGMRE